MDTNNEIDVRESMLVTAAAGGDLEAFNDLVSKYQDLVYNLAVAILGDHDGAQDVAQESFLSAFRHLSAFRGGSFRSWLLRIVSNNCYSLLRLCRRHPTVALLPEDGDGNEIESLAWLVDPRPSPQAELERADFSQALYRQLDALPADYRAVITLVDLNGIDYADAARALNIPVGTVKSRLARARLRIRQRLSDEDSSPSGLRPVSAQRPISILC